MGFIWSGIKFAIFAVLVTWCVSTLNFFGLGKHFHTHWPGQCKRVRGITTGSEDGEMVTGDLALITSGLCVTNKQAPQCADYQGKMLLFDFSQPESGATQVKIIWNDEEKARDFHPHGMSVWWEGNDIIVMVVSHESGFNDFVELFVFDPEAKALTHTGSVSIPGVGMFNDVKATGPRSFYFTNYFHFPGKKILFEMEVFLRLPLGWVGYYDGESNKAQVVASGYYVPNGVQMSPDGKLVYICNTGDQSIDVFKRHANNSLELIKKVDIHTSGDNISLDPDNSALWLGGIPHWWKCLRHHDDQSIIVPSQVLKLPLKNGIPTGEILEIYAGNGEVITGTSSLGLYHKSKLFIGTVHDGAAICDVLHQ